MLTQLILTLVQVKVVDVIEVTPSGVTVTPSIEVKVTDVVIAEWFEGSAFEVLLLTH